MNRKMHAATAAALGTGLLLLGCGEATSRATSFQDEAGHSCRLDCPEGSSGCAVTCAQAPDAQCGVNQTEHWIATDLAWPAGAGSTVLLLCPACDDLYVEQRCSPVTCAAPQDCPFARHDCTNGRCERTE